MHQREASLSANPCHDFAFHHLSAITPFLWIRRLYAFTCTYIANINAGYTMHNAINAGYTMHNDHMSPYRTPTPPPSLLRAFVKS